MTSYCPICDRETVHQRKFSGWTILACILTHGGWLFVMLFYPKRCNVCGSL